MKKQHTQPLFAAALAAALLTLSACASRQIPSVSTPAANDPPAAEAPVVIEAPTAAEAPSTAETPAEQAQPETPAAPERTISYAMLLNGSETTVYLDVNESEIVLWDSASGGQIVTVARYAQPMPGAAEALQDCDFTDLDADGSSDLSANFAFPDGTSASLLWFYTDGGFVYNEEFSILPGDAPAGNEG